MCGSPECQIALQVWDMFSLVRRQARSRTHSQCWTDSGTQAAVCQRVRVLCDCVCAAWHCDCYCTTTAQRLHTALHRGRLYVVVDVDGQPRANSLPAGLVAASMDYVPQRETGKALSEAHHVDGAALEVGCPECLLELPLDLLDSRRRRLVLWKGVLSIMVSSACLVCKSSANPRILSDWFSIWQRDCCWRSK